MDRIFQKLKDFDWLLFFSVFLLICFGLVEIYSVALSHGGTNLLNFKKQILFIAVGLVLLFVFAFFVDYNLLRGFGGYIYLLGALVLLAVFIFGKTVRGTQGWFYVGGFGIQPVEFVKIVLILFLSRFFSSFAMRMRPFKQMLVSGLGSFVLIGLVLAQPDFGSSMILLSVWLIMIALAGFDKKYFLFIGVAFLIFAVVAWLFFFKDYQKQRVLTFLNPSFDPLSQGYNISQAIIAVGAGQLSGRGIGFGSQSQLKFLPEAQNDFIFAVVAEELGFIGVSLILSFFFIFFYRCLSSLKRVKDDFGIFFILGAVGLIFVEMFINIGMNIGMLPVIGISLPFVSYGGSSMVSSLVLVGIIENIIIRSRSR